MLRSVLVFSVLMGVKLASRILYRHDTAWVGESTEDPWRDLRLALLLNHTSLFEVLFAASIPNRILWRMARHGVVPAADVTMDRPIVGRFYRFVAGRVVSITRRRDATWQAVLDGIGPRSFLVMAPEGRMKRVDGRDKDGQPMTVRGGIADILESMTSGRMILAYSGGLHHVQVPGQRLPKVFRTIRMRFESLDIAAYRARLADAAEPFKQAVIEDLEARRDRWCPPLETPNASA